jgi:hypothetical protein
MSEIAKIDAEIESEVAPAPPGEEISTTESGESPTPPAEKIPTASPGTWPYSTEPAAEAAVTRARKKGYTAEVVPPEGEEGQYVVTITESGEELKPVCRYCEHLVDVRPPHTHHYIGACEFGLRPDTCEKFELAECFQGHDPRLGYAESPTPPALSEDEMAIPGFGEKFERCVLDTKAKGGAVNPYAVCRANLRRSHGLSVGSKK